MVARVSPSQARILAVVAGPRFSTRPMPTVFGEVGEVEVQVELGLRVPAGEGAEGFGLADPERVVVAGGLEVGGAGADLVVEGGEGEGVAGDVELAGAGVLGGVGVVQGHVPGLPGAFFPARVLLGHVLGDGVGDGPVEAGDADGVQPGGEEPVDVGGGLEVEGVGLLGDPAAPPDRHLQGLEAAPGVREPVDQVEGVGEQGLGGVGGHPEGEAEGFGCERGHQRGALPAQRLVGVQVAVAAPHRDAGVGGGGVQDAPLVGELELAEVGFAADAFVVADRGEQRVGSEVVDPGRLVAVLLMGLLKHSPPTVEGAQKPLSTRGNEEHFRVPEPQRSTRSKPYAGRRR